MKISVVIPAYNAEKYIEKAVESAHLDSESIDFEVIIVNDGSTDNTLQKSLEISQRLRNIVVVDQANAGAMAARARGALRASGDYVIFCDADDTMEKDNLMKFAKIAFSEDYDIVVGCSHDFSADKTIDFIQPNKVGGEISSSAFIENILEGKIIYGPACKLFRRNLITEKCFDLPQDIIFNEDLFMNISIAQNAKKIFVINDLVVYNHLIDNPDSVTHTKNQNEIQWLRLFEIIKEQVEPIRGFDMTSFLIFVCDRLRTNYFNIGIRFGLKKEALALLDNMDCPSISIREKTTLTLLKHPILVKIYNLLFLLRKKFQ